MSSNLQMNKDILRIIWLNVNFGAPTRLECKYHITALIVCFARFSINKNDFFQRACQNYIFHSIFYRGKQFNYLVLFHCAVLLSHKEEVCSCIETGRNPDLITKIARFYFLRKTLVMLLCLFQFI